MNSERTTQRHEGHGVSQRGEAATKKKRLTQRFAETRRAYYKGCVLRIETTINNPRRFKVYSETHRHGQKTKGWLPMRKSIADIKSSQNTALSYYSERASRDVDLILLSNIRDLPAATSKLHLKTLSKKRNPATLYYKGRGL